jgi:hypothetical protein
MDCLRQRDMARILLGALLVTAVGCTSGPALPKTYPAGGTVVTRGGTPMTSGSLQLTTTDDPLLRVFGTIDSNGHFTLTTMKDNARADGAPAGEFRVVVQPPPVADPRGGVAGAHKGVPAIVLPTLLRLEAQDNTNLKIELP